MPSKTRSGAQVRVGRPKADPMSCATKSYKKSHPNTSLMSCSASKTCRQVPGKAGKRCTMKLKRGRVADPKKVKPLTAKRRGRPLGAKRLMKELPQLTPEILNASEKKRKIQEKNDEFIGILNAAEKKRKFQEKNDEFIGILNAAEEMMRSKDPHKEEKAAEILNRYKNVTPVK